MHHFCILCGLKRNRNGEKKGVQKGDGVLSDWKWESATTFQPTISTAKGRPFREILGEHSTRHEEHPCGVGVRFL